MAGYIDDVAAWLPDCLTACDPCVCSQGAWEVRNWEECFLNYALRMLWTQNPPPRGDPLQDAQKCILLSVSVCKGWTYVYVRVCACAPLLIVYISTGSRILILEYIFLGLDITARLMQCISLRVCACVCVFACCIFHYAKKLHTIFSDLFFSVSSLLFHFGHFFRKCIQRNCTFHFVHLLCALQGIKNQQQQQQKMHSQFRVDSLFRFFLCFIFFFLATLDCICFAWFQF